ncbi:MAG: hypothetical protein ACI9OJ_000588 [Myxococcota bacterium]
MRARMRMCGSHLRRATVKSASLRGRVALAPLKMTLGALLATAVLFSSATVRAGGTDPLIALGAAQADVVAAVAGMELTGTWSYDDILQVTFPLVIVVHQGATFVRIPVNGPPQSGTFAGLADGLSSAEVAALEATGGPEPLAALVRLDAHNMYLSLPPLFADGTVRAQLYVDLPSSGVFVSNSILTTLNGVGP